MSPQNTYELEILIKDSDPTLKDQLSCWFAANGVDSYVEGQIDELDVDHEVGSIEGIYDNYGGKSAPLSVYSFEESYLQELKAALDAKFGSKLHLIVKSLSTQMWQEGWKDSFKPIDTRRFRILPPWLEDESSKEKINIIIDPGMAFGTGQHASTRLCLKALEDLCEAGLVAKKSALDVGCGSAILSIALKRLGFSQVSGCDIDADAILSAKENLARNNCGADLWQGSVGQRGNKTHEVVVANILFVVLSQILVQLEAASEKYLILAGLISEQQEPMLEIARKSGLVLHREYQEDDWVALVLEKKR